MLVGVIPRCAASLLTPNGSWPPSARTNKAELAEAGPSWGEKPVGKHPHTREGLKLEPSRPPPDGRETPSEKLRSGKEGASLASVHPPHVVEDLGESQTWVRGSGRQINRVSTLPTAKCQASLGLVRETSPAHAGPVVCGGCRGPGAALGPGCWGLGRPCSRRAGQRPRAVKRFGLQVDGHLLLEF